jgi:predicted site-specific integrase-resolvase
VSIVRLRDVVGLTEAARLCGLSVSRLRYLVDVGRIPAMVDPVGRRLLRREAVLKLSRERAERDARHRADSGGSEP